MLYKLFGKSLNVIYDELYSVLVIMVIMVIMVIITTLLSAGLTNAGLKLKVCSSDLQ